MKSEEITSTTESNVVPVLSSGVVDVNCSDLSTSEIRHHLSSRLCSSNGDQEYQSKGTPFF